MIRILHLTDFHLNIKTLKDWNDFMKSPFLNKIREINNLQKIDLVVFTGDLIDQAGKDFGTVTKALEMFNVNVIEPILTTLDLDISKFIICPGNHDVNRNADKSFNHKGLTSELKTIDAINNFTNICETDYDGIKRIEEYKAFEFELYKEVEDKSHSKFKFSIKLNVNGKSVGISSLNSSWRCYGDDDYKNILLGENQLNDNFKFIEDCDIKIALMHHQLDWLSEVESKIIKSHISSNYDLVFSGHVHATDLEFVQSLNGSSLKIISPSGLNQIREQNIDYINGFSVLDYGKDGKCYFYKYNHSQKKFVDNTDVCENGVLDITLNYNVSSKEVVDQLILDEEFRDFLNDSGANFTHRSKILTLDDIYVYPYMEQFDLNDNERTLSCRSEDILDRIIRGDSKHTIILGEENSGKTSFCKQIFRKALKVNDVVPIFIKGRDIKKVTTEDIKKLIQKEFRKHFNENVKLETKTLFIIIDDLNNSRLPRKSKKTLITNLQSLEYQTIITWDEYFTLSELLESQVTKVEVYEILKFGNKKRLELIRKWIELIDDGEFEDDESREFQIKELFKTVNVVIGKNLIPSLPIYILTILQANELTSTANFEQSTFGHYYDVLIKSALGKSLKKNSEIEKYYSYLTELSFWLYDRGLIEIDENQFMEFHSFFIKKYSIKLSFRDVMFTLETSNLLQKNIELYKFKYKYIYFYFIGKYFSDNIEKGDIQNIVIELSNKIYQTESANIYIFLSHHSKSKFIIDQIIERARGLFNNELMIGFNSDISSINNLIIETTEKIDLIELNASTENEIDDTSFSLSTKTSNNIEEIDKELGEEIDDEIDSISKINKAFKTIEILGYIIKNRYASLEGVEKLELVEELYKLGLRSLTFLFKTLLDGKEYIKNEIIDLIRKDPNSALTIREREELAKQFMFNLLYMISYSIFKRISSSISSKDLEITFNDVHEKLLLTSVGEKNNAVSLINMAIIFEYSKSFPENDVKVLADDINNNPLAFSILKRLGVNFMRMINLKESEQQKASDILNISVKRQRVIGGTSKIKK